MVKRQSEIFVSSDTKRERETYHLLMAKALLVWHRDRSGSAEVDMLVPDYINNWISAAFSVQDIRRLTERDWLCGKDDLYFSGRNFELSFPGSDDFQTLTTDSLDVPCL
jgi:hypothetical protein